MAGLPLIALLALVYTTVGQLPDLARCGHYGTDRVVAMDTCQLKNTCSFCFNRF